MIESSGFHRRVPWRPVAMTLLPTLRIRPLRLWALVVVAAIGGVWLVLSIPGCEPRVPSRGPASLFVWDRDALFADLERRFVAANRNGCDDDLAPRRTRLSDGLADLRRAPPTDERWDRVEAELFELAAQTGGCPREALGLVELRTTLRDTAKEASRQWGPTGRVGRDRLYRLLYGSRAAVEEVLLQLPPDEAPALSMGRGEPSPAPSVEIRGVRIHSGDLLLSRGGAPTSAFIARGNDHPGNFSHVALVHVDQATHEVSVIEAHIERGVAVADVETYLADKKLRILVMRLWSGHEALVEAPMLPHRVATDALEEARRAHIPYDFAMDFGDPERRFCSEVASHSYAEHGIELWTELSTFSSPGLARWMAGFGVEHMETQSPSDLEYDPQLVVVAEWHDPGTLFVDHVDNAVIDVMIEQAEAGASLEYDWRLLPVARLAKGYSLLQNLVGREGPVPEGMGATTALRVEWLGQRHRELRGRVLRRAEAFRAARGYTAPYWELVRSAREAAVAE